MEILGLGRQRARRPSSPGRGSVVRGRRQAVVAGGRRPAAVSGGRRPAAVAGGRGPAAVVWGRRPAAAVHGDARRGGEGGAELVEELGFGVRKWKWRRRGLRSGGSGGYFWCVVPGLGVQQFLSPWQAGRMIRQLIDAHHFFRSSVSTTRGYTRTVPQKIKASQIPSHGHRLQEDEISRLNIQRILPAPRSFIVDPCACIDPPGSCLALVRSPDGTNLGAPVSCSFLHRHGTSHGATQRFPWTPRPRPRSERLARAPEATGAMEELELGDAMGGVLGSVLDKRGEDTRGRRWRLGR